MPGPMEVGVCTRVARRSGCWRIRGFVSNGNSSSRSFIAAAAQSASSRNWVHAFPIYIYNQCRLSAFHLACYILGCFYYVSFSLSWAQDTSTLMNTFRMVKSRQVIAFRWSKFSISRAHPNVFYRARVQVAYSADLGMEFGFALSIHRPALPHNGSASSHNKMATSR